MKTDDLVTLLARNAPPVAAGAPARRLSMAVVAGLLGAAAIMAWRLGLNPDLIAAVRVPMFWAKVGFVAAMLAASAVAARRLATPGARAGRMPLALAAPLLALWLIAAVALLRAAPAQRAELMLGETWRVCPFYIALLSLPAFIATMRAMKELAPTGPRLAGAGAGLLAAATGTLIYTLHCPEMAAPFLAIWYVLGMLIPTVVGALLGPLLLRW